MKRRRTKILSLLLMMAVSFTMVFSSVGFASAATASETKDAFTKTGDYLYKNVAEPSYGSVGGEWVIFGLGSAGYNMSDAYLAAYQKTVESRLKQTLKKSFSKKSKSIISTEIYLFQMGSFE